ncbi:MAG: hypothetical protein JSU86_06070 [Phycisphaerales bacterium]|nr:MAG: hypothetical protein JSU86_06070 [Phycisphaerales bacterium]
MISNAISSALTVLFSVSALPTVLEDPQVQLEALSRAAQEEGENYTDYRDQLLAAHPEEWDVEAATKHAWEAGLLAFILNARHEDPEGFAKWDKALLIPMHNPRDFRYLETRPLSAAGVTAFELERQWKKSAFPTLIGKPNIRNGPPERKEAVLSVGAFALWRRLWEESGDRCVREMAIELAGRNHAPEVQTFLREVLCDANVEVNYKVAALRGVEKGDPPFRIDLALQIIADRSVENEVAGTAMRLVQNETDPKVRTALVTVARDKNRGGARCAALGALREKPEEEHILIVVEVLHDLLDPALVDDLEYCLGAVSAYPFEPIRPVIKKIAYSSPSHHQAKMALSILLRHGNENDEEFVRSFSEDERIPEELRRYAKFRLQDKTWRKERKERVREP